MARLQVYTSDEVAEKIAAIVKKRRAEGAQEKDASLSNISTMLLELGLRVYEAQMERKASPFNQMLYNETLLKAVIKSQYSTSKLLEMMALSSHLEGKNGFSFDEIVKKIRADVDVLVDNFFPKDDDDGERNKMK